MYNDWSARNSHSPRENKQTCDFCGCTFKVLSFLQDGHNESEEYYCPDCEKEFRVRANNSPEVTKISSRTDGRDIKYADFIKQNKKDI